MFYLADLVGYVQVCTEIQKSSQSSNTFFDVHLQVAQEQKTVFNVMVKAHEFSKRQLFLDAMVAQKPIMVKHLQVSSTGTLFSSITAVQYLMHLHMMWTSDFLHQQRK